MDNRKEQGLVQLLPGLLVCIAQTSVIYTLLSASRVGGGTFGGVYPVVLMPFAALVYLIDLLFLRRDRSVWQLCLLNGVLWLLLTLRMMRTEAPEGALRCILTATFCALPALQGARLCLKPPTLNNLILWTDVCAVCMIIMAAAVSLSSVSYGILPCLPSGAGLAFALCGLMLRRMERMHRGVGLLLCGLLGVLLLLAVFLVGVAAEPAGRGITAAWHGLGSVLTRLWALIERGMEALVRLIPKDRYDEAISVAETGLQSNAAYSDDSGKTMGYLLFYIIFGAAAAAVVAAICVFGRQLLGRRVTVKAAAVRGQSRSGPFREALKRSLEALRLRIRVRRFLRNNALNSVGIVFTLERVCLRSPMARKAHETPAAFLLRLETVLRGSGEAVSVDFEALRASVDRAQFCPGTTPEPVPGARELVRALRRQVRTAKTKIAKS